MEASVWIPVLVALITAACGVPVMTYLGQRFSAKSAALEQMRQDEIAERIEWRKQQAQAFQSLKLEYLTLSDAHRDTTKRLDDTERRCNGLESELKEQHQVVDKLIREKDALQSQVKTLEAQIARLYRENDQLRTNGAR